MGVRGGEGVTANLLSSRFIPLTAGDTHMYCNTKLHFLTLHSIFAHTTLTEFGFSLYYLPSDVCLHLVTHIKYKLLHGGRDRGKHEPMVLGSLDESNSCLIHGGYYRIILQCEAT